MSVRKQVKVTRQAFSDDKREKWRIPVEFDDGKHKSWGDIEISKEYCRTPPNPGDYITVEFYPPPYWARGYEDKNGQIRGCVVYQASRIDAVIGDVGGVQGADPLLEVDADESIPF